jgi:NitT/TauT family transport system ATP-binding protein
MSEAATTGVDEGKAQISGASYIRVENLSKTYTRAGQGNVLALRDIALDVAPGSFVSLLGPSGCGKSTLLRCVGGLDVPTSGRITLRGAPVAGPPERLGMVFQRDVLLDWRTVLDNVLLAVEFRAARRNGIARAQIEQRARTLLASFGLAEFIDRYPWELSGGMRQRASICRALVNDPDLLLMDEPFGALDALTRDELNVELQRIWLTTGKTVLFVTHSISEAVFLSDAIAVMSARPGRIVETLRIDLPRPRRLSVAETPEFIHYCGTIRALFEKQGVLREE